MEKATIKVTRYAIENARNAQKVKVDLPDDVEQMQRVEIPVEVWQRLTVAPPAKKG